jgi:Rrf2 family protein
MAPTISVSEATALGLHAMILLASSPEQAVTTAEMAQTLEASEAHLAKVLRRLAAAGMVRAIRGPKDGFVLGRSADSITLLELHQLLEGPVTPHDCLFDHPVCTGHNCFLGRAENDTYSTALKSCGVQNGQNRILGQAPRKDAEERAVAGKKASRRDGTGAGSERIPVVPDPVPAAGCVTSVALPPLPL